MATNLDVLRAQPLTLIGPATQTLADGGSISVWRRAMEVAIRRSQTASFIAGVAERLGVPVSAIKKPSRAERKELDKRIDEQLKYLDKFTADLRAGNLTMAQAQARADLYAGAVRGGYYEARYPSLNQVPGDGQTVCLGNCKCTLDERDKGIYWTLNAGESCPDCVELANGSPYSVEG